MDLIKLTEAQKKSRRQRNIALGLVLAGLVLIFYVMTIIKVGTGH
jgi:high-affinity K+ transport system ATPase subunit B